MSTQDHTSLLKAEAIRLGFSTCGISKAEPLSKEAELLDAWLKRGFHASMKWMEENQNLRTDPTLLVENAKSVISVTHNYYNESDFQDNPAIGRISRYAWNKDYHRILRKKLAVLLKWMNVTIGEVQGRAFVDSAPIMDKAWAQRAGIGWIGKHSNLINRKIGSYFFIGELVVDKELTYDSPEVDHCGSCTRCIDACPTDAITEPFVVDAKKCISYATIEHRGTQEDAALKSGSKNWIFGCDICQEVCPWNKFSVQTLESRFRPVDTRMMTRLVDWLDLTQDQFDKLFQGSAIRRTGYDGFMRNVRIAMDNMTDESTVT